MRGGNIPYKDEPIFGMSANRIGNRIREAARAAGLIGNYSGHLPSVGMAQDLSEGGAELPALMTAGRRTNPEMPARYTKNVQAGRGAVARYYAERGGIRNPVEGALKVF